MGETSFFQALLAPYYWEALKESEALALNGTGCCEYTFASFREWFVISFSVFATKNKRSVFHVFSGIISMVYFLSIQSLSDDLKLLFCS